MTLMTDAQRPCPHCGAMNPTDAAFCEACGKALPRSGSGPRVASGETLPTSAAGTKLVSGELQKQTKTAATALLVISIIQLVIGAILLVVFMMARNKPGVPGILGALAAAQIIIGSVFLGLFFWAKKSPLPATITGLVVYGTLLLVNIVVNLKGMTSPDGRPQGLGIGCLDIVIIILLVRGINAALKQRRLLSQ